uniref:Uncharacterized protein n=1 Tax=Aegilops tauschii subsp. strangulata TaxID=200361 RepID=A0A453SDH2_AEGTS
MCFFRSNLFSSGCTTNSYLHRLLQTKYRERVLGLILVSPLCRTPSWTEWFYNKVMSNLLYYYGMCDMVKDCLLQRYFGKRVRGGSAVPESDIMQACRSVCTLQFFLSFIIHYYVSVILSC